LPVVIAPKPAPLPVIPLGVVTYAVEKLEIGCSRE